MAAPDTETRTFWITKHALTRGIVKAEGCVVTSHHDGIEYASRHASHFTSPEHVFARIGVDAWATEEEAKARAIVMIGKRLTALDREAAKLRKLTATFGG